MKPYSILLSKRAKKELSKLDKSVQSLIASWIQKNLQGTGNPRLHGKPLSEDKKGYWRYRVGNYRIIAEIMDEELTIIAVSIAHRSDVYKKF